MVEQSKECTIPDPSDGTGSTRYRWTVWLPFSDSTTALCLAILFVVTPVFFFVTLVAFSYATADLVNGVWAVQLIAFVQAGEHEATNLLGSRNRFVWSALAVIYVPTMLFTSAYSLFVVGRRSGLLAGPVVGALVIAAIVLGTLVWFAQASQLAGCFADACGAQCPTGSSGAPFSLVPYLGAVFCSIYEPSFVGFFRTFIALTAPLHFVTQMLFLAAVLSLLAGPRSIEQWTTADLKKRVFDFMMMLILGSAMFTHTGLLELTLWGWLVEIAGDWPAAMELRNIQVGSTLYWGICNSALMLVVFVPIGILLNRQARALARTRNRDATDAELEAWERSQGVTLRAHALGPQIGALLAPLLTGSFAFLFEQVAG